MSSFEQMQKLLTEKAELQAKIRTIPFDGSIEVKTVNSEKYIYVRKREAGKYRSSYIDKYSDELYNLAVNGSLQVRELKKQLRKVEKQLAELGYSEGELSPRVLLNIDFARANVKSLIYDQAVLEGIATTFPQTETILENGEVNGVKASDVQKILNLKRAWELIVDPDVVESPCDYYLLSQIARLVNDGFFRDGGAIRNVPVSIGGSSYIPPIPTESDVKDRIRAIVNATAEPIDKAIDLALFCIMNELIDNKMIEQIKSLLKSARQKVAAEVNSTLLMTYWQIGKIIVEDEQQHESRAEYGKQTLKTLSRVLTDEYGKGFSRSNLQNMRQFYLAYPKCQSVTGKLSWMHYCELLLISDEQKRSFYEKECANAW